VNPITNPDHNPTTAGPLKLTLTMNPNPNPYPKTNPNPKPLTSVIPSNGIRRNGKTPLTVLSLEV